MITTLALTALIATTSLDSGYPSTTIKKELYATNDLRGKAAPELFFGELIHGEKPEPKGKVVLVDFWATWCGPCRAFSPKLNEWKKKFGDDLVIVGVSDEPASTLNPFLKDHETNYIITSDPEKKMSKALGIKGIPHVMVVSPDKVVRFQGFPNSAEDPLTTEKLEQIIKTSKAQNN
ncbi:MAG: TlpA family protein disulfide reductase [Fimbriimonadaceae bacterium]